MRDWVAERLCKALCRNHKCANKCCPLVQKQPLAQNSNHLFFCHELKRSGSHGCGGLPTEEVVHSIPLSSPARPLEATVQGALFRMNECYEAEFKTCSLSRVCVPQRCPRCWSWNHKQYSFLLVGILNLLSSENKQVIFTCMLSLHFSERHRCLYWTKKKATQLRQGTWPHANALPSAVFLTSIVSSTSFSLITVSWSAKHDFLRFFDFHFERVDSLSKVNNFLIRQMPFKVVYVERESM